MKAAEFLLKTCLFIVLPVLLIHGCLRQQEAISLDRAARRAYLQALPRSAVTAMTIVGQVADGHLVHKRIVDPSAFRKVGALAKNLRPVRIQPGAYRLALREYTLFVVSGRDTSELVFQRMPVGRADLLRGSSDSAYEAPQFMPFLDSLFYFTTPELRQSTSKTEQGLRK